MGQQNGLLQFDFEPSAGLPSACNFTTKELTPVNLYEQYDLMVISRHNFAILLACAREPASPYRSFNSRNYSLPEKTSTLNSMKHIPVRRIPRLPSPSCD
jgi:hypothetical protein